MLDVAEKGRIRPDHKDALALERKPMGVEQVGRPVQSHRHFACPRTSLHDQDSGQRAADDLVLLSLNGRHDVPHTARPRALEGGEQHLRAGEAQADARIRPRGVEQLILQVYDPLPLGQEVTAAGEPHRMGARRPVERLGHGGPPVDHQRLLIAVGNGQPADVEGLRRLRGSGLGPIDPSEYQSLSADLKLLQPPEAVAHPDVTFRYGLKSAPALAESVLQHGFRRGTHGREPFVRQVHVGLLGGNVGVRHNGEGPLSALRALGASHAPRGSCSGPVD